LSHGVASGRLYRLGWALLLASLLVGCSFTAPRSSAGFADLDSLGIQDVNQTMTLSIGPTLLRFAASHIDDDEPETRALLRSLEGVRIRIYEIDGNSGRVAADIKRMSRHLQEDGWQPVLLVRENREQTHMLAKIDASTIRGLTLLTSDGSSEAVVINLMGDIQPERFSDVMLALEVDAPTVHVMP